MGLTVLPEELRLAIEADPSGPLPADALAGAFPLDRRADAVCLCDGYREIQLVRFASAAAPPETPTLYVGRQIAGLPEPIERQWAHAFADRSKLYVRQTDDDSREGIIELREETDEVAHDWDIDPERSYAIVRQVTYQKRDWAWRLSEESKATRFERLPNGPWYVTTWDVRTILHEANGPGSPREEEKHSTRRLAITAVEPDAFPAGLFDGDKMVEEAQRENAIIRFGAKTKYYP
jgi:hypothetical protein